MYKLYWSAGSAAMAPQAIILESGAKAEFVKIDDEKNEQKSPPYLKLNPHGRVPTLVFDDSQVMYESAAICQFLTERHPDLNLAPGLAAHDRARYLQWMAYLTNTVQEAIMHWWHGENFIDGADAQAGLKEKAEQRLAKMWAFLDAELAARGPHLCGAPFYACDYFLVMLIRWSRLMAKPGHAYPQLNALIRETLQRPAYAKMLELQGIEQAV